MATKTGSNFFAPQGAAVQIALTDENGLAVLAKCTGSLPTTANTFQHGCIMIKTDSGEGNSALYENTGSPDSPSWTLIGGGTQ